MSDGWAPREFQVVRRGYATQQVDETFEHLVHDLTVLRAERDSLRRACAELEARVHQLATEVHDAPTYRGLGERVEGILQLAEEEATEVRENASQDARRERELAQREAASMRADAAANAEETRVRVETQARHLMEAARREADDVREDAERFARARRDEADNVYELNRAKAAETATDFEIMLAQRRDQAERDFAARLASTQAQLEAAEQRAAALESEAAAVRAQADRKAAQTLEAATALAEERVREATGRAERARQDSERELAAMMQRRDSINAQLTNVRQMLATLTGSAAAMNPLVDLPTGEVAPDETVAPPPVGAAAGDAPAGRPKAAPAAPRKTTAVGRVAASLAARSGAGSNPPKPSDQGQRNAPAAAGGNAKGLAGGPADAPAPRVTDADDARSSSPEGPAPVDAGPVAGSAGG